MPANHLRAWRRARRDTWLLRAAAMVISIMLWMTVLGGKKVEMTKKIPLDYQLPKGLVISNQVPREVSYRVAGPRAFLKEIEDREMTIGIDLTSFNVGEYEVPIREDMLDVPLGLRVLSVSQSTIPLKIERVVPKWVPIRAVFAGQLPAGIRIARVTLKPSTVEIRGAPSRLQSIESVPTEPITPSPNSLKQETDVRLSMLELPGIHVDEGAKVVHVVAELEGSLSRKWIQNVPITVRIGAGRNAKYVDPTTLGIRIKPATVNFILEGPDEVISKLKPKDVEVWAEIPALKQGRYKARLDWRLAPELRVVKRSTDSVEVVVPQLQ
jgi:YbbR domain-containing protein